MEKCKHCNAELPENSKVCEYCGEPTEVSADIPKITEEQKVPHPIPEPDITDIKSTVENPPVIKVRRKNGAGAKVLCVFLAFLMFISLLAGSVFFLLSNATGTNTIERIIEKVDFMSIKLEGGETVAKEIETALKDSGKEEFKDITEQKIRDVMEHPEIKDDLGDIAEELSDFISGKTEQLNIPVDELMEIVEDNEYIIEEKTGYKPSREDYKQIESSLKEYTHEVEKTIMKEIRSEEYSKVVEIVQFAISPLLYIACFAFGAVLLGLMVWALTRRYSALMFASVPTALTGVILLAAYILVTKTSLLLRLVSVQYAETVTTAAATVMLDTLILGVVFVAFAAVMIGVYIALNIIIGKKYKKYAE